jgi:carbonic anhydrase
VDVFGKKDVDEVSAYRRVQERTQKAAARQHSMSTIAYPMLAVVDDVNRLRNHPLIPKWIPIYGYVYDATSGKLIEVEGARKAGRQSNCFCC